MIAYKIKMTIASLSILLAIFASTEQRDPSVTQLPDYKNTTNGPIGVLTTDAGAPVNIRSMETLNSNLLNNEYYMDAIQSTVRERIPDRAVHAPGMGAFGYFETTHDISHICKAKLFSKIGKKTPVAVRFSLTAFRTGIPDTMIGSSRGFAVKFYTEEGNFDFAGFNVPVFPFKNPAVVLPQGRILQTNPATNLIDPNMTWDFITLNPESIFINLYILSDYGAPASYADMTGHSLHTYQVYNKEGVSSYMRFHIIPTTGAKYLNGTEARKLTMGDMNYYARGLYNRIGKGDYPCYDVFGQILTEKDRKKADMDIFDVTKELDVRKYPLVKIGKITLNRNVQNHFAQIECLAFSPGNVVPGIHGSPDKIYEARRFTYRDAQMYRLGSNYKKIPVNCPINSPVFNYIRDGVPPLYDNGRDGPNYYPNSFNGPIAYEEENRPELLKIHEEPANNFKQAGEFYTNVLTPSQRTTLIENIISTLCTCEQVIKNRAVKYFKIINIDFGKRVAKILADQCA